MIFLNARVADQDRVGVINHVVSKPEALGGEVLDFRGRSAAVGALGDPFLVILAFSEAFAAFLEDGIVFGHLAQAFPGLLREGFHRFFLAGLADREFENAFGTAESFVDNIRLIKVIEPPLAGEAGLERTIVLKRMKVRRNLTHAQECPEGVTNPTLFGTDSGEQFGL